MLSTTVPPTSGPPARRTELVIRPLGDHGPFIVKDPATGAYYHLGEEEHFLLTQLDGGRESTTIRTAFAERFGESLSDEDLQDFLTMARERKLLQGDEQGDKEPQTQQDDTSDPVSLGGRAPFGLRILYWRKNFFDPDRFFTWLSPKIGFFWTPAFVLFSAGCIVLAAALLWANGQQLAHSIRSAWRWETAVFAWLTLILVMTCHEFAHGLTCKRYGGEVHEVGFLLIFFMPCFYCNVSDAWLFREKSKRLWVTLAGGYFELFLWALAVFVWRLTMPGSIVNRLAFIVLSACGVQTLFNFNPLLKLDGYYLLSDWLEVPNLQQRAGNYVKGWLRRLLWGAARPDAEPRARVLLLYGLVSWLYSLGFLIASLLVFSHFLGSRWGLLGVLGGVLLAWLSIRGLFHGFSAGEVRKMLLLRHGRTAVWALVLGGVPIGLFQLSMEDRASGPFRLRPAVRAELRAPVAGFLKEIYLDEGDRASPGAPVARLEVPDLASRMAQKRAELREVQARLRLLEVGPRPEEVREQRYRVERVKEWRDLARKDLAQARKALKEELTRLDGQIAQSRAELDVAQASYRRAQALRAKGALAVEQLEQEEARYRTTLAALAQAESQKRHRQALGTREAIAGLDAEAELSRREKDLADAQATLTLLEAGSRPEELDAAGASKARLEEEARYLECLQGKQLIASSVPGLVVTPRLREKVGLYVREGDLICVVEESAGLEAEISLAEQDVARVRPGQKVELKARALPLETFPTEVERIAPAASPGDAQSNVTVYCRLDSSHAELRPEMTGHARVYLGRRSIGEIALDRALRFLRTEFWW